MDLNDVKTVGVVGAGTMGSGIAQILAEEGFTVHLFDETYEKAAEGKEKIAKRFKKILEKQQDKDKDKLFHAAATMNGFLMSIGVHDMTNSAFIKKPQLFIEAVFENLSVKQTIFRKLDRFADKDAILATNTSSISIKKICEGLPRERKEKIIGMHFMNPPYILKLLELVKSEYTSDETYGIIRELAKRLNREPILTSMDRPGFLCNRILIPSILEALRTLEENVGNIEDIDSSVKTGVAGAMDILKLGDLIGWDVVLDITNILYKAYGSRYEPPRILHHLVQEGFLGRKVKRRIFDFYGREK